MSFLTTRHLGLEQLESRLTPSTTTFVQGLYREVLRRDGSAVEVSGWVQQLDHGGRREDVADAFTNSSERHGLEVQRLYKEILHRSADSGGLAGWTSARDHGTSTRDIAEAMLLSPEYQNAHGDDGDFIQGLYHELLHRSASQGEVDGWGVHIRQFGRRSATDNILDSLERAAVRSEVHYIEYLDRHGSVEDCVGHAEHTGNGREPEMGRNFLLSSEFENHTRDEIEHGVAVRTEHQVEIELEIER